MAALIVQLGERQTENRITSDLKDPCSIHVQITFTNFNSSTGEITFFFTHNQYPPNNKIIYLIIIWLSP